MNYVPNETRRSIWDSRRLKSHINYWLAAVNHIVSFSTSKHIVVLMYSVPISHVNWLKGRGKTWFWVQLHIIVWVSNTILMINIAKLYTHTDVAGFTQFSSFRYKQCEWSCLFMSIKTSQFPPKLRNLRPLFTGANGFEMHCTGKL